jgi:hypothetical protein
MLLQSGKFLTRMPPIYELRKFFNALSASFDYPRNSRSKMFTLSGNLEKTIEGCALS